MVEMSNHTDRDETVQWIAQGPDVSSGTLLEHVEADPGIRVVRRIAPDVVILSMTAARAEQLKNDFAGNHIEADTDLDLFR
jgi:hypothetical protein